MDKFTYIGCTLVQTAYGQFIVKARSLAHAEDSANSGKMVYLVASIRRSAHVSQDSRPRADRGEVTINALAQ
jgi:hypothetical protein